MAARACYPCRHCGNRELYTVSPRWYHWVARLVLLYQARCERCMRRFWRVGLTPPPRRADKWKSKTKARPRGGRG